MPTACTTSPAPLPRLAQNSKSPYFWPRCATYLPFSRPSIQYRSPKNQLVPVHLHSPSQTDRRQFQGLGNCSLSSEIGHKTTSFPPLPLPLYWALPSLSSELARRSATADAFPLLPRPLGGATTTTTLHHVRASTSATAIRRHDEPPRIPPGAWPPHPPRLRGRDGGCLCQSARLHHRTAGPL